LPEGVDLSLRNCLLFRRRTADNCHCCPSDFDSRPKVTFSQTLSGPHPARTPLNAVIDGMLYDA
jgi:hypothetical protein